MTKLALEDHGNVAIVRLANGVTNAQQLVKQDADTLQRLRLPASAIWLDRPYGSGGGGLPGWGNFDFDAGSTGFPHPDEMIADLEGRGMHLLLWIANRANNAMSTDPLFGPFIFNVANGWGQTFTATPAVDLRQPFAFVGGRDRIGAAVHERDMVGVAVVVDALEKIARPDFRRQHFDDAGLFHMWIAREGWRFACAEVSEDQT